MVKLKRIVLDVLKPHHPNILEFARAIAALGQDYRVQLRVDEVDDKTESVILAVEGGDIDLALVQETIELLGASLHSIDEVEVTGAQTREAAEPAAPSAGEVGE